METDIYKTIDNPSEETLFKDKNSKFFGYAFPVKDEDDVKECLELLKKKHHAARHFCYAYQIGVNEIKYRANDDGEPNNAAGMPIYGQIQSFQVTNILIVTVRYFGGIKLGVGGLIAAYKTSAQLTLEASKIVEKTIDIFFKITFGYDAMNTVMQLIKKKNVTIVNQHLELECEYLLSIRKKNAASVLKAFDKMYKVSLEKLETQTF